MDPVQQTLAQGQTQESSTNLADYYFKGRQSAQQDRQLNLSQQRLMLEQQQVANENAKLPYQLEHIRLTNINEGIANRAGIMQLQALTQQNEALPELLDLQLKMQESPDGHFDQSLIDQTRQLVKRVPQAFAPNTQGGKLLDQMMATAVSLRRVNQIDSARVALDNPNSILSDYDPATGRAHFTQRHRELAQSPLGKLQADRQAAIDAGDFESAAEFDKQIDLEHNKTFAPSAMAKKINEYHAALASGDERTIKYYEENLGLAGLSATDKGLYKAGLAAINADPTLYKAADKQKAQEQFTADFTAKHAQSPSGTGVPPTLPRISNPSVPQTFTKGEKRQQNGHTFEFDGSKWNRVQ